MFCKHCGVENPADANFCANCGQPLARDGDATTGALQPDEAAHTSGSGEFASGADVGELELGTALLLVVRGPNDGARFLLDRDVTTVGRHPESDIFLDDITVSRRHAEFRRDGHRFWVHDVGSLNGTYVGSVRTDDQLLANGDEVQVGKFKLVAYLAEQGS